METVDEKIDLLKVVNRSKTYLVSKKLLCSSIPYFEKMFCCDLLESKENEVTLDFDESGFNNILSFVYSKDYVLNMENVLPTYDCCEYLMFDDLKQTCSDFFYKHFKIHLLPIVLASINERSKLINYKIINCFIRRHFLKISNTEAFYNFPIDLIEYILKLDLVVDSEYQVFDAIKRWILFNTDRKEHFITLMKLIRWCYVDDNDLTRIKGDTFFGNSQSLDEILCSPDSECKNKCTSNRVVVKPLIMLYEVDQATIEICVLDGLKFCLSCGPFTLNDSLSTNLIADEHVTDIIYDSGRKGVRVDWQLKVFKYLEMIGTDDSYYGQLYRYIFYNLDLTIKNKNWLLTDPIKETETRNMGKVIIDLGGILYSTGTSDGENLYFYGPIRQDQWYYTQGILDSSYHTSVINDTVHIIAKDLIMVSVNTTVKKLKQSPVALDEKFQFEDLLLANYGDQLLLCHKPEHMIYAYNQSTQKWSYDCQLNPQKTLIAVSSTYTHPDNFNMLFNVN